MVELVDDGGFHTGDHTGVAGELHGNDKEEDVVAASSQGYETTFLYKVMKIKKQRAEVARNSTCSANHCTEIWVAMNFREACFGAA
jgi:hypothetical protein